MIRKLKITGGKNGMLWKQKSWKPKSQSYKPEKREEKLMDNLDNSNNTFRFVGIRCSQITTVKMSLFKKKCEYYKKKIEK